MLAAVVIEAGQGWSRYEAQLEACVRGAVPIRTTVGESPRIYHGTQYRVCRNCTRTYIRRVVGRLIQTTATQKKNKTSGHQPPLATQQQSAIFATAAALGAMHTSFRYPGALGAVGRLR